MITTLEKAQLFSICIDGRGNYLDMCYRGELSFLDLDGLLERYKLSETRKPLREVMGLTEEEYIGYTLKGSGYIFNLVNMGTWRERIGG